MADLGRGLLALGVLAGLSAPVLASRASAEEVVEAITQSSAMSTIRGELQFCGGERNPQRQLQCYQKLSQDQGVPVAATAPEHSNGGDFSWSHGMKTAPDGVEAVAGLRASDAASTDPNGGDEQATLYIRCSSRQNELYVEFNHPTSPNEVYVKMGVNGGSPNTWRWYPSANTMSLGLWNSQQSVPLARSLLNANDFTIQVDLPENRHLHATFKLSGMDTAITDVRRACGW